MTKLLYIFLFFSLITFAQEVSDNSVFSLQVIDKLPVYSGCTGNNRALKLCMSKKISKLIMRQFNTDLANDLDLNPGKKRILVRFTISETGLVENIEAKAPHKALEREAIRIIKKIPPMKAGEVKGRKVRVKYTLPIHFVVDGDTNYRKKVKKEEVKVAFLRIDEPPVHPKCTSKKNFLKRKKCFVKRIAKLVRKNFNKKKMQTIGLMPGKKTIDIYFEIDKKGIIQRITTNANNSIIKHEVQRVIKLLPKLKPGYHNGKYVTTKYHLKYTFKVKK